MNKYDRPIPELGFFNWEKVREIAIEDSGEELVPLSLMPERILVRPQYYIQKIKGALPECYIREGVYNRLVKVASNLPVGYKLLIFDAWRPVEVQISLFNKYYQELKEDMPYKSKEELINLTKRFVALPSNDPDFTSPHITGGAVDLTIVDDKGKMLSMGTGFDEMGDKTYTRYYEEMLDRGERLNRDEERILYNRRMLYYLMIAEGFTNYPPEWWHYDYGNQNWAWMKGDGRKAIYGKTAPEFRWENSDFKEGIK